MSLQQNFDDFSAFHEHVINRLKKQENFSTSAVTLTTSTSNANDKRKEKPIINNKVIVCKRNSNKYWFGITPSGLLEHAALLTSQATLLTANFLAHHLTGPRRPSWPVQVTLMSSFMRNLSKHTHLASVQLLRRVTEVPNPLIPSDIVVTPVTFPVYNRGLCDILREHDQKENGTREIDGEWVVPKTLLSKINHEFQMNSSNQKLFWIDENNVKWSNEKVILAIHGGAYYLMSTRTHRDLNYRLSKSTGRRVFAINYRLAPEGPFPCGFHDVVHSYLYLTDPNGLAIQPQNIVVAGDSAGGGLTLALLFYLRDHGMPLPGGTLLFSPWVDLTMSCSSWELNKPYDIVFKPADEDPLHPARLYLDPFEERSHLLTHPYVSPLFGDMNHLPPLLIQCGDSEVLRDEIILLVNKIEKTGTTFVQHEIYEDMIHVFQTFGFLEPAQKAVDAAGYWVKNVLPLHQKNINLLQKTSHSSTFSGPLISNSLYRDNLRSTQSTPTMLVTEDTASFEDEVVLLEEATHPEESPSEENNKLSGMIFFGPSEPLPTKCDKSTSTEEDGITIAQTRTSSPLITSNEEDEFKQDHISFRPRRRFRSSSHPELRQLYTMFVQNMPTPEVCSKNSEMCDDHNPQQQSSTKKMIDVAVIRDPKE
ncbi:13664_t:CDS:2 [Ambispora gerdemannii]|uniref:13664_t:CDS:1 n=1 Tax=Ambispora gerdemannii TaxID=144530 RepID=A0A9N8WDA3_9GLOM|nr:13664_t:CDS:2 [Ambispora gerdemannii]